jgi:hypothetical protein
MDGANEQICHKILFQSRTEVNVAAVADLVKNDLRIVSRIITEYFNIPKTVVLRILKKDFCSRIFLFHDNVPANKTASVLPIFNPKNLQPFITPPYSPYLSPPGYFLFSKLKMRLKVFHFADVAEIQEAVTDEF